MSSDSEISSPTIATHNEDFFGIKDVSVSEDQIEEHYNQTPLEALQTSYEDLYAISKHLPQGSTICDLGAGHCTMALLYSNIRPDIKTISIEYFPQRTEKAKKSLKNFKNALIIHADLRKIELPKADYYFIYLPQTPLLHRILIHLKKKEAQLIVIESHGDVFDFLKELSWIRSIRSVDLVQVRHHQKAYFYQLYNTQDSSITEKLIQKSHTKTFEQLLIRDERGLWLGDIEGIVWGPKKGEWEVKFPKTIISTDQIIDIVIPNKKEKELIQSRRKTSKIKKIYRNLKKYEWSYTELKDYSDFSK